MNIVPGKNAVSTIPFDHARVDRLMEEAGIDVLLATSKHNTQYLLGGYKFIFFAAMDAIGHSRYLPIVVYEKGGPDHAAYIGNRMEGGEHQNNPFWTPTLHAACWGTLDAANLAVEHLKKIGKARRPHRHRAGFPAVGCLYADPQGAAGRQADRCDRHAGAHARHQDGRGAGEAAHRLRTDHRFHAGDHRTGRAKARPRARSSNSCRREETNRGAHFEYCLLTLGSSHNRAASPQAWKKGEVLSIDSGGNYHGYIGDLCRMGILGEPDAELEDLLAEVETVQQAAFSKVKAGTLGGDMISYAEGVLKASKVASYTDFFAHGMGLITHEAPFLMTNHPVTYEGTYAEKPLEKNMVLSVETTMLHPTRGFIKLEDTVAVTDTGYVMFGDRGRGWNRGGA